MSRDDTNVWLSIALVGALVALLVANLASLVTAPFSSPIAFDYGENEQGDGPASLSREGLTRTAALRLAFVGDIMQHRAQAADDFDACYRDVRPLFAGSDLIAGNLEFPVDPTRPVGPPGRSVQFNGTPAHLAALARAGFRVLSTANNHCFDQGLDGLMRTQQELTALGVSPVGNLAGGANDRPVILERNGYRLGFFAYTFRPNSYAGPDGTTRYWHADWPVHALNFDDWSDEYRAEALGLIARHVQAARKARVDWFVAIVHWGKEWRFQPTADQRLAGHDLIDQGFDLVVGSHSHVLNPIEVYRGKLIAYSLGNLISDFRPIETRTGAVLKVDIAQTADGGLTASDFRAIPVVTELPGHRVRPLNGTDSRDAPARDVARRALGAAYSLAAPPVCEGRETGRSCR